MMIVDAERGSAVWRKLLLLQELVDKLEMDPSQSRTLFALLRFYYVGINDMIIGSVCVGCPLALQGESRKERLIREKQSYSATPMMPAATVRYNNLFKKPPPLIQCNYELFRNGKEEDFLPERVPEVFVQAAACRPNTSQFNCISWALFCAPSGPAKPEEPCVSPWGMDLDGVVIWFEEVAWVRVDEDAKGTAECVLLGWPESEEDQVTHAMVRSKNNPSLWQSKLGVDGPIVLHPRDALNAELYGREVAWFVRSKPEVKGGQNEKKGKKPQKPQNQNPRTQKQRKDRK